MGLLAVLSIIILQFGRVEYRGARASTGRAARLISAVPLPESAGMMCEWMPASYAPQQASPTPRAADTSRRKPIRTIHDNYPAFSSVAVDVKNNEVVVTDENLFQLLVYNRTAPTPPPNSFSEPKRILGGPNTKIEFQCGLYIDPNSGDVYAVNNDTVDTLVIFTREQKGNATPAAELRTPHGTFGIDVVEERNEMFLSLQHSNAIVVFDKFARNKDNPKRLLQGNHTGIADPHGIGVDPQRKLLYVTNHGSYRELNRSKGDITQTGMYQGTYSAADTWPAERRVAGTGKTFPSSITVYDMDAQGNTPPLRTISGPKTQLNWPTGLAVDRATGELYVANDMGDSILIFAPDAAGDAAPVRVLKGPKTLLKNPTGITLDQKNGEFWVANFGNHTATVYKLGASGDTPPLRSIRSGPVDEPALMIGNPGSVAYDSKREQILVPN
jgi:DNA-binding beta-propeller fold protein YncE